MTRSVFEFPPPRSATVIPGVTPGYPAGDPGGRFIVSPAPGADGESAAEVARAVGEHLGQWGDLAEWAAETAHNQGLVLADYGEALERKVEPWAVPTVAPLSSTINRRADPTFQLSDFMVPALPLAGNTRGEDGHFHALTGDHHEAGRVERALARGAAEKGRVYLAFITPAINRAYSQLNFMVSEVTSPCQLDVGVFVVNEDRTMFRQVHQVNAGAGVGIGEAVVSVTFPRWVATQGSYLAVAFLQHGSGNTRSILGLHDTPRPLSNQVFPRKISAIHTGTGFGVMPASIDGTTAVDFGFWFTPYAELSEDLGIELRSFTESWPDVGRQIGRPWVPLTSQGIGSSGGYTSAYGSGLRVSMYDTPLSTDRVRVRSSIAEDSSSGTVRRSTLIVRGTNDLRSGLGLSAISRTRYELIRWTGRAVDSSEEWDDRTVLVSIPRAPQKGDRLEVDYLDGLVTVRINDQTVVDGLSAPGLAGAAYRFLGVQNRRQSFITASWSPWFGPWSARDLPPEADGDDGGDGD